MWWLGMEGSNLRFLSQSQASYHWTNPHFYTAGEAGLAFAKSHLARQAF